jgi:hypothetical protein
LVVSGCIASDGYIIGISPTTIVIECVPPDRRALPRITARAVAQAAADEHVQGNPQRRLAPKPGDPSVG